MKLIAGLGNPEKDYDNTRHNIGFRIVDEFQKSLKFEDFHKEKKFDAKISIGECGDEKVIVVKPLTFMNLSGESLMKIVQFYKIAFEDCLVVYDDLDLPLGTIRLRKKGSAGTHNGMKSIVAKLGSVEIPRLRFGIESRGVSAPEKQETVSFVLSVFNKEEEKVLSVKVKEAISALEMALKKGFESAMNIFNVS